MSWRMVQINNVLRDSIAEYMAKEAQDGSFIITISYVNSSRDLSSAEVGVKIFPQKASMYKEAFYLLNKNKRELQLKLARDHKLKNIPVLNFVEDKSSDKVDRVDELLNEVDHERR